MTTKIFSKNAVALSYLKKHEGFTIVEMDGKFHAMDADDLAAYNDMIEAEKEKAGMATPSELQTQIDLGSDGGSVHEPEGEVTDELQQQYDGEGTVTLVIDMGVNPVGLDRTTTTMKVEHFGKTRYVIQQQQTDGTRKFLPAAGDTLVAWKFHAAQFDTAEKAVGYIAGEQDLSVVPFRKAWQETFHQIKAAAPAEAPAEEPEAEAPAEEPVTEEQPVEQSNEGEQQEGEGA